MLLDVHMNSLFSILKNEKGEGGEGGGSIFYSHLQGLSSETAPCVWIFRQEKAAFRELIAQLELDPKCKGLPFSSFLILPFQRITRLKLLVQV